MTEIVKNKKTEDLTGQDRFAWNLFVSWASQFVLIFSGFLMPRLVDEKVGQVALGIWDFGWSFVSYLAFVGLGMGAAFNRYIAKHRAEGDFLRLNKVANSVALVQFTLAFVAFLVTILFYFLLPTFFADTLTEHTHMAQGVVLFLGFSLVIDMASGSARGLLTGYHRWDIHNALHAGSSVFSLVLMMCALYFSDWGVVGMAIAYCLSTLVFELLRFVFVAKVCKEFSFNLRLANIKTCREMMFFGIKSMVSNIPPILLLQTINILLVSTIGPAALAVFARPMALTKQVRTFMSKFTLMLAPTTGSMQGKNDIASIRSLFMNTTKLSFAFALPSLGFLCIYGDVILKYWMGNDYALWHLIMILSLGGILPMSQDTSLRILIGMNQHGRIAICAFISLFVIFSFGLLFSGINSWELTTAALLYIVPMNIVYGFLVPIYTCRALKLSWLSYARNSLLVPVLYILPFFMLLCASRYELSNGNALYASLLFVAGLLVTVFIYFKYLLAKKMQLKFLSKCGLKA